MDESTIDPTATGDCVIIGNFRYPPNMQGLARLLQSWKGKRRLRIIGDIDHRLADTFGDEKFEFTGHVREVAEFVNYTSVGIDASMNGSGTSTKLLLYASLGLPVVCTEFSVRGLDPGLSSNFYQVETPEDICEMIEHATEDFSSMLCRAEKSQEFVREFYNIRHEVEALFPLLQGQ